ncbi:MAG: hypothetical protein PF441_02440 [Desulfuromusa sp.]|jgi:hypothetical protein|nr:hypothetical protein [Desulfuromusa sp.]
MNLKTKSLLLVSACFVTILALSYGLLKIIDREIGAGVVTQYAREQVNYNRSQTLQLLKQELVLARTLANSSAIKNWAIDEDNYALRSAALLELEGFRPFFSDQSYFCVLLKSGHYYVIMAV